MLVVPEAGGSWWFQGGAGPWVVWLWGPWSWSGADYTIRPQKVVQKVCHDENMVDLANGGSRDSTVGRKGLWRDSS